MKRTPMTVRGAEALRVELKRLKSQDRPNVIRAIAEARAHGDLSENAEYHAAREQQGFIEGRIQEIEAKLSMAEIIDPSTLPKNGTVVFGAVVDLEDQDSGARLSYQIVGRGRGGSESRPDFGDLTDRAGTGGEVRRRYRRSGRSRGQEVLRDHRRQALGSGMMRPGLARLAR